MPKGKKLGPRTIILVAKANAKAKKNNRYALPLKSTAEHFGIAPEKNIIGTKGKNGRVVLPRGSKGAGSISIPKDNGKTDDKGGGDKMLDFPIPGGCTHPEIVLFIKSRFTKNKPSYYVSKNGVTRYIEGL